MKKFILAWVALLGFAGPCLAAFAIFQTYTPSAPARTQVSLSTYGATCNGKYGDYPVTITNSGSGLRDVEVVGAAFVGGDVGKRISITGTNGSTLGTIASVIDATHITVSSNANTNPAGTTQTVAYGTDDTAAFLAFRAAFTGATPVQLNLPGNCSYVPDGGPAKFPFKGVTDLIVSGSGPATSGILNVANGSGMLFGGGGQIPDSNNSVQINTANAGDSCVIQKTAPSITISGIGSSVPPTATFTASSSGTTLTVTSVASGTIVPGAILHNATNNAGSFNTIQAYGTAGTTGVGGTGTYALSTSATYGSTTVFTAPAAFTADVNTTGVLNVTAVQDGALAVGMALFGGGYGGLGNTTIKSQIGGTPGGIGTYQLDNVYSTGSGPVAVASRQFQALGQIRLTVNSTVGLTSGDTLFITGVVGTGQIGNQVNGLKWIKVVNGTQIDLFQWARTDGAYTSGGTAGGDRTALTPVGSKVMIGGYSLQSYWGAPGSFPANYHWYEWKTVTSVNSSTHQVCFDTPLVNTYKDTWPRMNTGSQFEGDPGGPATLYHVEAEWDSTHVYKDFALVASDGQTKSDGRSMTWSNIAPTGPHCMIPSQNETYSLINVAGATCSIETDKLITTWNITNSQLKKITVQSSSIGTINVTGSTIDGWTGSPKKLNMDSSSYATLLTFGTYAYGASDESLCTNCTSAVALTSNISEMAVDNVGQPWSMSGGVITIPNAYSRSGCCSYSELQSRFIVPGYYSIWDGAGDGGTTVFQHGRVLKVIDVTQDLDNTYIQTSELGGFPTGAWTANGLRLRAHPAPKMTVSFLPGSHAGALWYNGCTAQAPMYSCANYTTVGGAAGTTPASGPEIWGELTSFTFTNNVPYTNAGALSWSAPQFAVFPYLTTSNTQTKINFTINTKLPSSGGGGTRTWTSSGVTGNQAGDTFPSAPPAGAVFGKAIGSIFSANTPSDTPEVTVNLRTNQNLPP